MVNDKYSATWVSNSSMKDFLNCPRLYYLRNVYKDPSTNRKITIINPALALGQAIHQVLEPLAFIASEKRMQQPLLEIFDTVWEKFSGRHGGFSSKIEEKEYKDKGKNMLLQVLNQPGPLINKAIRLPTPRNSMPPNYLLSAEHNIILCGKVDWLEYVADNDSVHIIDFKTGLREEHEDSMQLPIYCLLVKNCQKRNIDKVSYWYLVKNEGLTGKAMPNCEEAEKKILNISTQIKKARTEKNFECKHNGCRSCLPFEAIINKNAEYVTSVGYQDIYVI